MRCIYENIFSCSHLHNIFLSSVDYSVISALNPDCGKSRGFNLRKCEVRVGKLVSLVGVDFVLIMELFVWNKVRISVPVNDEV